MVLLISVALLTWAYLNITELNIFYNNSDFPLLCGHVALIEQWEFSEQLASQMDYYYPYDCHCPYFCICSAGIVCLWKAHLQRAYRWLTQASSQGSGNQSRGLKHMLRLNVKFSSLFVYLPPSSSGWFHCSEWRHVEKEGKKEERIQNEEGGGGRGWVGKKWVTAIRTSLTAGRK